MAVNAAEDVVARLKILRARTQTTWARAAVTGMGELMIKATRDELGKQSHQPGTLTPSAAGEPPAMISGDLRNSIAATIPVSLGPGRYMVEVGGTTIYARIQQMGGDAGRNTKLDARPYLQPAVKKLIDSGAFTAVAGKAFMAALRA